MEYRTDHSLCKRVRVVLYPCVSYPLNSDLLGKIERTRLRCETLQLDIILLSYHLQELEEIPTTI